MNGSLRKKLIYIDFLLQNFKSLLDESKTKKGWCGLLDNNDTGSITLKLFVDEIVARTVLIFDKKDFINNKEYLFYRLNKKSKAILSEMIEESEEYKFIEKYYNIIG